MGFATSTVKYILFIFNLLCALVGIGIIALGSVYLSNIKSFKEFMASVKAVNLPIAIIVLGSCIFIIAFFGCCGAIRESHCMTITYSVFLFILLVLQIIAVVFLFVSKDAIKTEIKHGIETVWERAQHNSEAMGDIQQLFQCCGKDGPQDYLPQPIPKSCCPENGNCILHFYKTGCKTAVSDTIGKGTDIMAYVGLGVFAVELVGFIFACCLANHIRNHKRRSTY